MYLLLRNNKQTGPFTLEELATLSLKPHDLIWIEGRSAGWSYPAEITALKPLVESDKNNKEPKGVLENTKRTITQAHKTKSESSHIYVALPAVLSPRSVEEAATPETTLQAKAEVLYQRMQAYAAGKTEEPAEADRSYTRSLDAMQHEYGAWLLQQQKRKRNGVLKKKILIAASVIIITTTGFGLVKWMTTQPAAVPQPTAATNVAPSQIAQAPQTTTASFNAASDTFSTITEKNLVWKTDSAIRQRVVLKNSVKSVPATKKSSPAKRPEQDTAQIDNTIASAPISEPPPTVQNEMKKVVPLSRLVTATATLQNDKNEATGAEVRFQNNSSEVLKTVAITVRYFRKENRLLNKMQVYFYNVPPGSAPVLTLSGNRRATAVQAEIGTIIRADGSLYLIH